MTAFPSIQADVRAYPFPRRPASTVAQRTGWRTDFSHDPQGLNSPIQIEFTNVKETDRDLIIAHYRLKRQHQEFQIPETIWQNHADVFDLVPSWDVDSQTFYVYELPPSWEMTSGGLFTVRVVIRSGF